MITNASHGCTKMYVVVSYDISDNKRRTEVMNRLKSMGYVRVQRSLYVARGGSALAKDTARSLMRMIGKGDLVVILVIDGKTLSRAIRLGTADLSVPSGPMVV